jgi:hypothetical protein
LPGFIRDLYHLEEIVRPVDSLKSLTVYPLQLKKAEIYQKKDGIGQDSEAEIG